MIKAVIFDMDGLMFETESAYSVIQENMSQKRGKVFTLEVKSGLMGKRAYEVMHLLNEFWGGNEKIEDLLQEQDEQLIKMYKSNVEMLDGLPQLLDWLEKKRIQKCIGTSSRRFLVDILLKKFDLTSRFEFIVSGDDVSNGKPHPEIYNTCVRKLGMRAAQTLVLEDSINGIRAAVSAGCYSCAIPSEFTSREDFSMASLIAKSLADTSIVNFIEGGVLEH